MSEENKAIVRRVFLELINKGNLDVADEVFAPGYVFRDPLLSETVRGPEGFKRLIAGYLEAAPDARITIHDQIAEGDTVMTRWTAHGTHTGDLMGYPATGKRYELPGVLVSRLTAGKIVEDWEFRDDLGMLQQVGAIPRPGRSGT